MLIKVNAEKAILEYSTVGGLPDSIEYTGTIPDDFEVKFKPSFYMLQDDEIIENSNYVEPSKDTPTGPTDTQTILKAMASQMADHCALLRDANKEIDDLKDIVEQLQTKLGGD